MLLHKQMSLIFQVKIFVEKKGQFLHDVISLLNNGKQAMARMQEH